MAAPTTPPNPSNLFLPLLPGSAKDENENEHAVRKDPAGWYFNSLHNFGLDCVDRICGYLGEIETMREQLQAANNQVISLRAAVQDFRSHPASSSSHRLSEKLPDIPKFGGKKSELRNWITKLHLKLDFNADRFAAPKADLFYAINRLEGNALTKVQPHIVDRTTILFDNLEDLLQLLNREFGDPDISTAQQ